MDSLFLKILDMSRSAGWLVLAVLLLRQLLKKAPRWIHCCLWALVALRLVCPFSLESSFSLIPAPSPADSIVSEVLDDYTGGSTIHSDNTAQYPATVKAGRDPVLSEDGHSHVVTAPDGTSEKATVQTPVLSRIWAGGLIVMLVCAGFSYLRLKRKVAASISLKNSIFLCDYIDTPFILGIFRPRIYLPSSLPAESTAYVLAHERAHLHRRDHWWKPLGYLLLSIYWFHPLLWLSYILLCRDIELACDERVIQDMELAEKKAYAEALVECSVSRSMIAACPLAFGEVGVKERVKSVLHYKKPGFWILLTALALCVLLAVCFLTDPYGTVASRLPELDRQEIDQIYLSNSKGSVSMTSQQELNAVWALLDSLPCSAKPYKEKSIYDLNRLDYARFHTIKFIRGSEEAGMLYFYLPESAVCPVTDDPMLQYYPIRHKEAVEDFFDLWINPVSDRNVTAAPFATGEEPFLWTSGISPEAVRTATRHTYSGKTFVISLMTEPRFETLIECLNALPEDAFGPMEEFSGTFATAEINEPNVGAVLQDGANGLTAAVRYHQSGEQEVLELLMVPALPDSISLSISVPNAKRWEIHDDTLLSFMRELYEKESLVLASYAPWLNWKQDTLSLSFEDATIELLPTDEWIYETVSYEDGESFGFRARPQAVEEGWLYFSFWPNGYYPKEEDRYYDTWASTGVEFDDGVTSYRSTRVNRFSNDPWRNVWSYQKQSTDIGDFAIISTFSNEVFKEYLEEITAVESKCVFSGGNPVPVSTVPNTESYGNTLIDFSQIADSSKLRTLDWEAIGKHMNTQQISLFDYRETDEWLYVGCHNGERYSIALFQKDGNSWQFSKILPSQKSIVHKEEFCGVEFRHDGKTLCVIYDETVTGLQCYKESWDFVRIERHPSIVMLDFVNDSASGYIWSTLDGSFPEIAWNLSPDKQSLQFFDPKDHSGQAQHLHIDPDDLNYTYISSVIYSDGVLEYGGYHLDEQDLATMLGYLTALSPDMLTRGQALPDSDKFVRISFSADAGLETDLTGPTHFVLSYDGDDSVLSIDHDPNSTEDDLYFQIQDTAIHPWLESLIDPGRQTFRIRGPGETVYAEYAHEYASIRLPIRETWEWETVEYTDDATPFGIRFRPKGYEGWIFVQFCPDGFVPDPDWKMGYSGANHTYYDVEDTDATWLYPFCATVYNNCPGVYAAIMEGGESWYEKYRHEVQELLRNMELGKGYLTRQEIQNTARPLLADAMNAALKKAGYENDGHFYHQTLTFDYHTGLWTYTIQPKADKPPLTVLQLDAYGNIR